MAKFKTMRNGKELRATEIYCHHCRMYISVALDYSENGNHVVTCPECDHEHCRVIKNGEITGDRWDSRNDADANSGTYTYSGSGLSTSSTSIYGSSDWILSEAWHNTTMSAS